MSDSFEAFLGAGAFKRVFAYGDLFVRKYSTEGRLREDIAALWTAYSWGLPVALPLYYKLAGRSSFFVQERLLPLPEGLEPSPYYQEWNSMAAFGPKVPIADIKNQNVGISPSQDRIVIHDCAICLDFEPKFRPPFFRQGKYNWFIDYDQYSSYGMPTWANKLRASYKENDILFGNQPASLQEML